MPYKSDKQRKYMHAKYPTLAKKWDAEIRKSRGKRKRGKAK